MGHRPSAAALRIGLLIRRFNTLTARVKARPGRVKARPARVKARSGRVKARPGCRILLCHSTIRPQLASIRVHSRLLKKHHFCT